MKTIDDIAQEHYKQTITVIGNGPSLVRMPGPGDYFNRYMQHLRDRENGVGKDINEYGPPLTAVNRLPDDGTCQWTVNGGWSYHPHSNLGFVLDDMKFHRAETHPTHEWYFSLMVETKIPVFTSKAYPDKFPYFIEYPLKEVVKFYKSKRFDETIDYELALCGYFGVKKVIMRGCDYQMADRFPGERAGTEYWLGRLEQMGIEIDTSPSQNLMKPSIREPMYDKNFYGFSGDNPIVHDKELLDIVNDIRY